LKLKEAAEQRPRALTQYEDCELELVPLDWFIQRTGEIEQFALGNLKHRNGVGCHEPKIHLRPMDEAGLPQLAKAGAELAPALQNAAESAGLLAIPREILGNVADRLHLRREKKWAKMATRAAERLRVEEVQPQAIRDVTLRAIFEHGAIEDDPGMEELWINLLSTALGGTEIPPAYPAILRELEPIEAKFLYATLVSTDRHLPQPGLYLDHMSEVQPLLAFLEWRHLDNLERLRLLIFEYSGPVNVELPPRPCDRELSVSVSLTRLGRSLVEICSTP